MISAVFNDNGMGATEDTGAVWSFTRSGTMWTQQGEKLTDAGGSDYTGFGYGLALSADGDTALIGEPGAEKEGGAALVFTRGRSSRRYQNVWRRYPGAWRQQYPRLLGNTEVVPGYAKSFGIAVALSGKGGTALIGAPGGGPLNNPEEGAAWVFHPRLDGAGSFLGGYGVD